MIDNYWIKKLNRVLPMLSTTIRPRGPNGYKGVGVLFDIVGDRENVTTHMIGNKRDIGFRNPMGQHDGEEVQDGNSDGAHVDDPVCDGKSECTGTWNKSSPASKSSPTSKGDWINDKTSKIKQSIENYPIKDCPASTDEERKSNLGVWTISPKPSPKLLAEANKCSEKARVAVRYAVDWEKGISDTVWANAGYAGELFDQSTVEKHSLSFATPNESATPDLDPSKPPDPSPTKCGGSRFNFVARLRLQKQMSKTVVTFDLNNQEHVVATMKKRSGFETIISAPITAVRGVGM